MPIEAIRPKQLRAFQKAGLGQFLEAGCWVKKALHSPARLKPWLKQAQENVAQYRAICGYFNLNDTAIQDTRIAELIRQRTFSLEYNDRCQRLIERINLAEVTSFQKQGFDQQFAASKDLVQMGMRLVEILTTEGREHVFFDKLPSQLGGLLKKNNDLKLRAHLLLAEEKYYKSMDVSSRNESAGKRFEKKYGLPASLLPNTKIVHIGDYAPIIVIFEEAGFRYVLEAGLGVAIISNKDLEQAKIAVARFKALRELLSYLGFSGEEIKQRMIKEYKTGVIDEPYVGNAKQLLALFKKIEITDAEKEYFKGIVAGVKLSLCFKELVNYLKKTSGQTRLLAKLPAYQACLAALFLNDGGLCGRIITQDSAKDLRSLISGRVKDLLVPDELQEYLFCNDKAKQKLAAYVWAYLFNSGVRGNKLVYQAQEVFKGNDDAGYLSNLFGQAVVLPETQNLTELAQMMFCWDEKTCQAAEKVLKPIADLSLELRLCHAERLTADFKKFINGEKSLYFDLGQTMEGSLGRFKKKYAFAARALRQMQATQDEAHMLALAQKAFEVAQVHPLMFQVFVSQKKVRKYILGLTMVRKQIAGWVLNFSSERARAEQLSSVFMAYLDQEKQRQQAIAEEAPMMEAG